MNFPDTGSDEDFKRCAFSHLMTTACLRCGRRSVVCLAGDDSWVTDPRIPGDQHFEVICCPSGSYWARWHDQWRRRCRNQGKRCRQALRRTPKRVMTAMLNTLKWEGT